MKKIATQREAEMTFAQRLGCTLEAWYLAGWMAVPCECGTPGCEGWQASRNGTKFYPYLGPPEATQ